jgi:hypothetical protein
VRWRVLATTTETGTGTIGSKHPPLLLGSRPVKAGKGSVSLPRRILVLVVDVDPLTGGEAIGSAVSQLRMLQLKTLKETSRKTQIKSSCGSPLTNSTVVTNRDRVVLRDTIARITQIIPKAVAATAAVISRTV